MKKIILTIILLSIMSMIVFSDETIYKKDPQNADLDIYDLNLYEGYEIYSNRETMSLPRYIPQYLGQELYLDGYSKYANKVVGRYVPRYWDGEKYTNFRTDGYNPDDLASDQIEMLDEISLNMYENKDTANKCSYVIEFKTTKDINPTTSKEYKNLLSIPYYYDLGYWYVPEINDAFSDDCIYLYDYLYDGSDYVYLTPYGFKKDPLVNKWCSGSTQTYANPIRKVQSEVLKVYYNASSYIEIATKMYNDITTIKNYDGTCTLNSTLIHDCISETQLLEDIKTKDNWMMNIKSGNYIPYDINYLSYSTPQEIYDYFYDTDYIFKNCQDNYMSNGFSKVAYLISFYLTDGEYAKNWDYCSYYIQNTIRPKLGVVSDWTIKGVDDVIWKHYSESYDIKYGSNLYPFNIKFSGIRCRENDSYFNSGVFNPLNPFAETPYVTCNYTSADSQDVKIGFYFDVKVNPVFSLIAGADNIQEAYNTEYFRHVFRNYDINLSQINILNFTGGFTIVSWVDLNRSKEDGCSFVYLSNESVGNVVTSVDTGLKIAQKEAEKLPNEVIRQIEVQLRLIKSEVSKTQFFFYIDVIAKLIFRMFILFYYCISLICILYIVKLCFKIPTKMLEVMRNLGTSKRNRQKKSILNED